MKKKIIVILIISIILLLLFLFIFNFLNASKNNSQKTANPDFTENITVLDDFTKKDETNVQSDTKYRKNAFNILLCGIDEGRSDKYWGRSDSMMIISVNKEYETIRIASLSRAVYVDIKGYKSGRLSSAYSYGGPNLLVETIESNYKIEIDKFVCINFDTFRKIIDLFGGVELYLSSEEAEAVAKTLKNNGIYESTFKNNGNGVYDLDGYSALEYSRLRYIDTDRERTARQRKVVEKLYYKVYNLTASQKLKMIKDISPLLVTDFTNAQIFSQFNKLSGTNYKIEQTVIPNKSSDLQLVDSTEVLFVDWNETIEYANSFFYSPPEK